MKLYEYPQLLRDTLEDENIPPEALGDVLEQIRLDADDKALACAYAVLELRAEALVIKGEEERLAKLRKAREGKSTWLEGYVLQNMLAMGMSRIETSTLKLTLRQNPAKIIPEHGSEAWTERDMDQLPQGYVRVKREPDKDGIKKAILNGEPVPGARLQTEEERKWRLEIR